jgi:predicted transcriptional regulator
MLKDWIISRREWLWDRLGYYMDRNGEAFIKFNKDKLLIEWYDNIIDKTKWKKMQMSNKNY